MNMSFSLSNMLEEFSDGWHQAASPSEPHPKPDGCRQHASNSASLSLLALKVMTVHSRSLIPSLFSVREEVNVIKDQDSASLFQNPYIFWIFLHKNRILFFLKVLVLEKSHFKSLFENFKVIELIFIRKRSKIRQKYWNNVDSVL